ncbi:MAG: lamin tail domain-containing protein [Planctomycetota bacterium]|jgi:hypothetical protein
MYHPYHPTPGAEDIRQEYIELFNRGNESVNLSGWRFSDGVDFVFPDVMLGAGEYLVVAADVNSFTAKYPGVTNVVGGWSGRLSNRGEVIELVDGAGVRVDSVSYADEGDWAVRLLGPRDYGHRGWMWSDAHDGDGKSLELINPALANEHGQNWLATDSNEGTPGELNTVYEDDIAPLILEVEHYPIIPGPNDPVFVTARIIDELQTGVSVTLHYRIDGDPTFNALTMFDDGTHGDSDTGDSVYASEIPAQAGGAIVEFYIRANDVGANIRTWPTPSIVDDISQQVTNALYQVDGSFEADTPWVPGSQPIYYIIMIETERAELEDIGDGGDPFFGEARSNAQMNTTFISVDGVDTKVRYNAGVRNRGNRTRAQPPNNYRVNFANDRPWKDVTALTINSKYPHLQLMGSAMFRLAGLPAPEATAVQLRINGQNLASSDYSRMYDSYVAMEVYDSDWAGNHFPDDDAGNLYRCTYVKLSGGGTTYADLDYKEPVGQTPDPDDYRDNYPKQTNRSQDDYSDLFSLIDKLNNPGISDANFLDEVNRVANLKMWMRYMAADALAGNREGGLYEGEGDDYAMYRGVEDPSFWLLPHDLDTLLGQGDHSYAPDWEIFGYTRVDGLRRLFEQPEIWKTYYGQYRDLARTIFAPENLHPVVDQLLVSWVPQSEIEGTNGIKQFIVERSRSILYGGYPGADDDPQIPQDFTVECDLGVSDGFYKIGSSILGPGNIHGKTNAIDTSSVLVNDQLADWSQEFGTWTLNENLILMPGINRIFVRALDGPNGAGNVVDIEHIDIWYDDGDVLEISGTLTVNTILDTASGPWHVTGDVTIPAGVTLTIESGTTLFFDTGTGITIQQGGRLAAEANEYQRIRLTSIPGSSSSWDGLAFNSTMEDNRLCYIDMDFGDGQGESINLSSSVLLIDNMTWNGTTKTIIDMRHPSVVIRNSYIPGVNSEAIHGSDIEASEYLILESNVFGAGLGSGDIIDWDTTDDGKILFVAINNVFLGGGDDGLDMDATDAYIEGNIFMNFHSTDPSTTSNAVAGGKSYSSSTNLPDFTIVRNIFVGNDHDILIKEGGYGTIINNVFVNSEDAAIQFCENGRNVSGPGLGAYIDGNIFWNYTKALKYLTKEPDLDPEIPWTTDPNVTVNNSIIGYQWHYLGVDNIDCDPLFVDPNRDFHLKPMSGAIGTGPWGLDMGAYVPTGVAISSEPDAITYHKNVTLTVGGPGITHYKYSINTPSGPWSEELSVDVPVELTDLVDGESYTIYAIGKNSAGIWQSENNPTASRILTIDTSYSRLIINEVLAHTHGADPDLIELYYDGPGSLDLSDMSLTDDPGDTRKFVFSNGTVSSTIMNPGDYLLLYGDLNAQLKDHLGFALYSEGEGLYLYDKPANGGGLIDSVEFGPQINDYSIGRIGYGGTWKLNKPSFGHANIAQPLGNPETLKINEWLANGQVLFDDDFIELFNPHAFPVDLSSLYLTDNPVTQPDKHEIVPLSFIEPEGYAVFRANDGNDPWEVDFKLSADGEMIGLFDSGLNLIDQVLYGPQTTDVSQGRAPNGSANYDFFALPTPGVANTFGDLVVSVSTLVPENADKRVFVPTSASDVNEMWNSNPDFDDSSWMPCIGGPGGVGYEESSGYEDLITLDVGAQMHDNYTSCYIRIPFTVDGAKLADYTGMKLKVRYDDGFVAYINGAKIPAVNFTGTPQWDSRADGNHEADGANFDVSMDISDYISVLKPGNNVLAIHSMNVSAGSSDFIISPELDVTTTTLNEEFPFAEDLDVLAGLRITELMYHAEQGSNYDYVELQNISDTRLNLEGVQFIEGIEFVFPAIQLDPGQYVVVVSNLAAFRSAYGTNIKVAGRYSGNLNNGDEEIILTLAWPLEAAIMRFVYSDIWYPTTDGGGNSLVIYDPFAHPVTWRQPESWHPASPTPGR